MKAVTGPKPKSTSSPRSRKEQKTATRLSLVQEARKLFSRQGIAQTSTAQIAQALAISHGTVFLHFPTRDQLILAVIEDFGVALAKEFCECVQAESLENLLSFHLDVLAQYEDFYYRLVTELHQLPAEIRATVFMMNSAISWKLFETAQPRIAVGEVKRLSRPQLFNTWMSLIQYHVAHRDLLSDTTPILKTKKRELIRLYLTLVQTNKGEIHDDQM